MKFATVQPYRRLYLYYFSGTGNSKRVSEWIEQAATDMNIDARLIDISTIDRKHIEKPAANSLIGFCSPTHGFNFPPVMMNFIFRFPGSLGNSVYLMNTRAGMKLHKLFLLGLILGYYLLHYLRRIRIINQLIQYTSFTYYPFWRRYKSILGKNLKKR
jgi:hypothetical protein